MRRAVRLLILVLLGLAWARAARAQSASVAVDSGTRLRVTACLPICDTQLTGELLWSNTDSLTLAGKNRTTSLDLRDVRKVEVGTPYDFDERRALLWGGGTALAVGLFGVGDGSASAGEVIGVSAFWGLTAAVFAGGSKKAVRGGTVGALLGAPAIGLLALATYEPCTGWCFGPESEGQAFALGAFVGAGMGFIIGGAIGAFTGGESWEEIPWNGVSLSAAPTPGGIAFGASVAF